MNVVFTPYLHSQLQAGTAQHTQLKGPGDRALGPALLRPWSSPFLSSEEVTENSGPPVLFHLGTRFQGSLSCNLPVRLLGSKMEDRALPTLKFIL